MEEKCDNSSISSMVEMIKEDISDTSVYHCKRKLGDTESQETLDNVTKFKKARHPWQIKGISIERNIISKEVTIDKDDPKHMVGVIKYEEKGILSVNLSGSSTEQNTDSKIDTLSKTCKTSNCNLQDANHPSTSDLDDHCDGDIFFATDSDDDISTTRRYCGNDIKGCGTDFDTEDEIEQSSMDHETSHSNHLRGRNELDDFPALNFQLCVWQKREMGCAIVDNVFNKTLEEMGLSPDPKVNRYATDRLQILQQGIDAAIDQRGLFPQNSGSSQMEHVDSNSETNTSNNCRSVKDNLAPRRLSLENIPSCKLNAKRRLSQPLSEFGFKYKEKQKADEEAMLDVAEDVDNPAQMIVSEEASNVDNDVDAGITHTTDINSSPEQISVEESVTLNENFLESPMNEQTETVPEKPEEIVDDGNETEKDENSSKPSADSDNLIDLAVSTVIKSQGLSL